MRAAGFPFVHKAFAMCPECQVVDIEQSHLSAQHGLVCQHILHRCANGGNAAIAAHARNHFAFMAQQIFCNVPAAVQFADNLMLWHHDIVEESFAKWRVSRNQLDRLCGYAGGCHIEQQKADALIFVGLVCADQTENPVGFVCIAGPNFLAVDDPMIAFIRTIGLHRDKVAARTGLGIALTPADFAPRDLWQIVPLLLFATEF